jgi:hypothetical protein
MDIFIFFLQVVPLIVIGRNIAAIEELKKKKKNILNHMVVGKGIHTFPSLIF